MRALSQHFPGAVLAFASMTTKLTSDKVEALRALATWGRRRWQAPVLVLTARELASDFGSPSCWKAGSPVEKALADSFRGRSSFWMLCDASQQVHLGLPPSSDWPHYESP